MNTPPNKMNELSNEVYPPSEDSWFLADFLLAFLLSDPNYSLRLKKHSIHLCEIGIGSGYISHYLCSKVPSLQILGTDISSKAIRQAEYNLRSINVNRTSFICTNLLNCINPHFFKPDLIIFNPPYVKTPLSEFHREDNPIVKSWAGGPDGLNVIFKFLEELVNYTFTDCFFLSSSMNDNKSLIKTFSSKLTIIESSKKSVEGETLICFHVKKFKDPD
jgi:methylase of polypeptide subunit release factors